MTSLWKISGRAEVNLGRGLCVFVRERGAESQLLVSLFLLSFFYLSFQSSSPSLFPAFLSFSFILRCYLSLSCFSPLSSRLFFFQLFLQTKQLINLLNDLNISSWSNIIVSP